MSTLFNLKFPPKVKAVDKHPWQSTIKDSNSHRIKHAHNSVKNPFYPKIKEKVPDAERVKFTIIGDRITKEFIYCVNLVNGLHKYRWKKFDVPCIKGLTSLEWEEALRSLKLQHGGLAFCLSSRVAVLINDKFLGGEIELKELIETRYVYHLILDYRNEAIANFTSYIRCCGRPCAYMHISIDDIHVGTLIFMLYADIVPYTCENFLRLCRDTKGGYSGTPIHRIVKDGWVQGGGFGLKSVDLDCENFIIPHDRRGVLCMANDGRHMDCSTQFFILLQPAPWMAYKYVAFGQLIEGEQTLKKIEEVPTWYESPKSNIVIFKAGILNMECQDIMINRGANEYISMHIEDLNALGELLIEALIERVYLEIELKLVNRLAKELLGEQEEDAEQEDGAGNIRAAQRFIRKKEEIEKQIRNSAAYGQSSPNQKNILVVKEPENKDFDVEEYELEETDYKHMSLVTLSLIVKPERHYYIPLTDVPYPGEIDSTYDLKKFLKGHYCLESDLDKKQLTTLFTGRGSFPSEIFNLLNEEETESESTETLDSEEEREIRTYLQDHADRVSFAGGVIKGIGRGMGQLNLLANTRQSELITDDQLRRLRLLSMDIKMRDDHEKKVSISVPTNTEKDKRHKIKRRQTGFVRPEDLEKIHLFKTESKIDDLNDDDDSNPRKVRIAQSTETPPPAKVLRRPTGFVRTSDYADPEMEIPRQSVLQRLYQEVANDDDDEQVPTLKDYKPHNETQPKLALLTFSPNSRIKSDDDTRERFLRHSISTDEVVLENVLNLQHGKTIARKISSDYVKTIDQIEHKVENSLRTIEFAKNRPSMRVSEYQMKNQKYQEEAKSSKTLNPKQSNLKIGKRKESKGIRLPGDSPLYSTVKLEDI